LASKQRFAVTLNRASSFIDSAFGLLFVAFSAVILAS
jgi:hypothetical protein